MSMDSTAQEKATRHLTAALDSVLAAIVLVGGTPEHVPDDALDAVLAADSAVQDARKGVQQALQRLRTSGAGAAVLLDLEAAVNAYTARCAEAGFRLGRLAR